MVVHFDPTDPEESVAVGADLWPGWAIVPVLLALPLLLLGGVSLYAVVQDALRKPKRGKARRPKSNRKAET